jgi:hypothetical protein
MNIQELKQYVANKRKTKAKQWSKEIKSHGECTGFTDKEYMKNYEVIITGKQRYRTKFVHNKMWQITR